MLDSNTEIISPFRKSKIPIMKPSTPVVKRSMRASSTLITAIINTDDKNTINPRGIFIAPDIAIGKVLNGLKAIPMAGKNTGADWNMTVKAINIDPKQINLLGLRFSNI